MEINSPMEKLLIETVPSVQLTQTLDAIVNSGFYVKNDCYFLSALSSSAKNVTKNNFIDLTGYECFVNSVHIDGRNKNIILSQAILFMEDIFSIWRLFAPILTLISIVSINDIDGYCNNGFSAVVKFHVKRPTERWLADNIESYEEPVMLVESSEINAPNTSDRARPWWSTHRVI